GAVGSARFGGVPHARGRSHGGARVDRGDRMRRRRSGSRQHAWTRRESMTVDQSTEVYYDPYDVEINTDPYPVFRRLRDEAPVYHNEQHGFYAVSRADDVERGLTDRETFSNARSDVLEFIKAGSEFPPGIFIFEDPPGHTMHRGLVSRVFTPKKMAAIEPQVRDFCARSLDRLVGSGRFDFVRDLGAQMPMRVIGMLLGIPENDQELVDDPSLIPNAIEEVLRYEPPGPHVARYVARDAEFQGQIVPAGNALLCLVGSANRDERRFPDPDRFDIHRKPGGHLTFSYG